MIFTGDIAIPYKRAIVIKNIPDILKGKYWIGNLEGSLIDESKYDVNELTKTKKVFNSKQAITDLCHSLNFRAFTLSNNHLFDVAGFSETKDTLNAISMGIKYVGAGKTIYEAEKGCLIEDDDGTNYYLISFGWDCINCKYSTKNEEGVNPYIKSHVFHTVGEALKKDYQVICLFHWGYELELYPLPYDRSIAKQLIDMGVSAVVGCHSHRVQQIEFYKGKPIVYSLGNFLFKNGTYSNGKSTFPSYTELEWAFEFTSDKLVLHSFHFDRQNNILSYMSSLELNSTRSFNERAIFENYSIDDYYDFFAKQRVKNKFLPIFRENESDTSYTIKCYAVKIRGKLINLLRFLHLKKHDRSKK